MQANTAYFNSNKFDITEMTALLTLWIHFMFKGLTATLYSIADWAEGQMMLQLGDLHEPNRVYPSPEVDDTATCDPDPQPMTIESVNPDPQPMTTVNPDPETEIDPDDDPSATVTYRDLQMMLRQYRDERGPIRVKLNAKRELLWAEVMRLKLLA